MSAEIDAPVRWPVTGPIGWAAAGALLVVTLVLTPPLVQDPSYHRFADTRAWLGVQHAWNVLSNAPFALVGAAGWLALRRRDLTGLERRVWRTLFAGVGATAAGSGYYHLAPDDARLFWDRLPMTIVFMSVFAIVLADRIHAGVGERAFLPLLITGVGSVLYWSQFGDLRPYVLVQFVPMLAIPVLLLWRQGLRWPTWDLMIVVVWYALAKLLEFFDGSLFHLTGVASGHTLKHLAGATAAAWLVAMLRRTP